MRKFFGKFVSVTLAAAVIAMFALSSDDKWCSRVDKAFDESVLVSALVRNLVNAILFILLYINKITIITPCKRTRIETKSVF
jgi:small basic protein